MIAADLRELPEEIIVDEHTSLRLAKDGDQAELFKVINSDPQIREFVTWPMYVTAEDQVLPTLRNRSGRGLGRYVIIYKQQIIGYLGVFYVEKTKEYGMGYFLDKSVRRRGHTSRCILRLIEVVRETIAPSTVYLLIDPNNEPSVKLAKNLDFSAEEMSWNEDMQAMLQYYRLHFE